MKSLIKSVVHAAAASFGPHRYASSEPKLWVLMYHRVLPSSDARFAAEEPGMIVTPATFRQQLRILKSLFEIMPLSEWLARRDSGQPLPNKACAVTFDDGWLDNYQFAFPILREEQVPATLFAVSHMIGTTRQFWPNRLARVLNGAQHGLPVPGFENLGIIAPTQRPLSREALAQTILHLKALSDAELDSRLRTSEDALKLQPDDSPALMNWDNIREMQHSGLVEIGSHTCNHFRLQQSLPVELLAREIRESRSMIEEQTGQPAKLFCYPNGDTCAEALRLVGDTYRGAVTTRRGINRANTAAHELLRIGIHEDIGNSPVKFEAKLSGWL
ncbi:MAG: polysaccharide deacetylase family protein [Spongiibacteraceae bacterium]